MRITGHGLHRHTLAVANHTSWIDILVLGGALGTRFVAKDELGHGFLHWLADQNSTIYINRGHRRGARDQAATIARALEGEEPIAIFPEGTTGPGTSLLPFRSTLLEAVHLAAGRISVRPVAIDYGANRAEAGWFNEEPGMANVMRILRRRGTMRVIVHVLGPLDPDLDRKQLTRAAQSAIAMTLGFKSSAHSPIAAEE